MRPEIRRRIVVCATVCVLLPVMRAGPGAAAGSPPEHPRFQFKVGHRVMTIPVPGSRGETRAVDVHLWYPADLSDYAGAPVTHYTSALYGEPLDVTALATGAPPRWDPLAWTVVSSLAREGPAVFRHAPKYPIVVFSHGNRNAPIDYAFTLEDVASAGFVVAAPTHVNNSQDEVLIDYANAQAAAAGLQRPFTCRDGRSWRDDLAVRCDRTEVPPNMADRVRDITYALDHLAAEFGNRVDLDRVGVLGHSRGTVTALTAAGGSTAWGIAPDPRVKAVMGMAIGGRPITFSADIRGITQPTLLVAGSLDFTSPPEVSKDAFDLLATPEDDKHYVEILNAVHRTFDSTLCEQMQSAGAIAQGTSPEGNSRALLDRFTALGSLLPPPNAGSGVAADYCGIDSFTTPADVRMFVKTVTGFDVTADNVPRTGLTTAQLRPVISELAVEFFEHYIGRPSSRWHRFRDDVPVGWLKGRR